MRVNRQVILKFGILNCLLLFSNCAVNKENKVVNLYAYDILNEVDYKYVSKRTLNYSEIAYNQDFNVDDIIEHNVEKNWVLEEPPHLDFDTIFNSKQRIEFNNKLKGLESVKLKNGLLKINAVKPSKANVWLSFPIIQEGLNGKIYAFLYQGTSVESQIRIFKKEENKWVEIGIVPMGIS